ncbi:MAG: hypothetical protein PCFJNLEI_03577 [Verrucomicrobiae bacterium]|nr:hypothetical protein [Verrucomicrobiae bacterium]
MLATSHHVLRFWLGLFLAGSAWANEVSLLNDFSLRRWMVEEGLPESVITGIHQGEDGFLWCMTPRHTVRFDGLEFVAVVPEPAVQAALQRRLALATAVELPAGIAHVDVEQVAVGADGVTWITVKGELYRRQAGQWGRIEWPAQAASATALHADATGALWLGTVDGVYRWSGGRWESLTQRDGLLPWDVRCLAEDREGNIWVGTTGGLLRLRAKLLEVFRTGLPTGDEVISALLVESRSNFWVGVAGSGLAQGPPESLRPVRLAGLPEPVTVSTLRRTRAGTLWIGTQGNGLWRWRATGPAERVGEARGISALLEDRSGHLWVGTWEGLMRLDDAGKLVPLEGELPAEVVTALCEDRAGQLWVGFQGAGLLCRQVDGGMRWFRTGDGLPADSIRALLEDTTGSLWVGTTTGLGLLREGKWHRFTVKNGLPASAILQIVEDDLGFLWLGTRRGIVRVKKSLFAEVAAGQKLLLPLRSFGVGAGMVEEECSGGLGALVAKTADGRLWFPTMHGVVMVDPQDIFVTPVTPTVQIDEVRAAGRQVTDTRLPVGARDVEFEFTTPVLTVPSRPHFRYRLEGFDADWSRATTERMVRYPRLPAGTYVFGVMARDRDGEWGKPATRRVVVPALVWETGWFRAGGVAGGVLLVGFVVRAYDRRKTARQLAELERRHALERERARIARDIHDDVGAGLTEVALLSELAQAEPAGSAEHLERIFQRSRELTQSLDEIVWAINPRNDTLEGFLAYLGDFAQGFLAAAGIACRLDFPRDPPVLSIPANFRHQLWLAVKEALHNIVKHAGATEVQLRVDFLRGELCVTIQDNGVGFSESSAVSASGDGLANLELRLQEIGGQVQRASAPEQGTRLRLTARLPE